MARKKKTAQTAAKQPLMLTSLPQLKALAHPLRFRMFERLGDSPATGKQLAELLGTPPTQLYHHLRLLERSGLIRQVATRKKRGTTEKYFEAVSDAIKIDAKLFNGKVEAGQAVQGQALHTASEELQEARKLTRDVSPKPPVFVKRLRIRTTREKIEELEATLKTWLESFKDASDEDGDANYSVTIAFCPTKIPDSW